MRLRRQFGSAFAVVVLGVVCLLTDAASAGDRPPTPNRPDSVPSRNNDTLTKQVDEAIGISARRFLQTDVHTPWQIMHGLLAFRKDYQIKQDDEKTNALQWIANGATYRGEYWFEKTRTGGRAHPYSSDYAFEGHANQFLGILAMADVPKDQTFKVAGNQTITVADMIRHVQKEVTGAEEVTWTLWALVHYLGPEARWENKWGETWSIERLVRLQTDEPVYDAACGGTHALFGLAYARNLYLQTGKPLQGAWLEAHRKIERYVETARSYQNRDGTFSSSFFDGQSATYDLEDRLHSCGHTLEFLMMALPEQRLKEDWVRRGVAAIAKELIEHRKDPIPCGALYHAVDALVLYRERTSPLPATAAEPVTAPKPRLAENNDAIDGSSAKPRQSGSIATDPKNAGGN